MKLRIATIESCKSHIGPLWTKCAKEMYVIRLDTRDTYVCVFGYNLIFTLHGSLVEHSEKYGCDMRLHFLYQIEKNYTVIARSSCCRSSFESDVYAFSWFVWHVHSPRWISRPHSYSQMMGHGVQTRAKSFASGASIRESVNHLQTQAKIKWWKYLVCQKHAPRQRVVLMNYIWPTKFS